MADRSSLPNRLAWLREQSALRPASDLPDDPQRLARRPPAERTGGDRSGDGATSNAEQAARVLGFTAVGRYTLHREVLLPNPIAGLRAPFVLDPALDDCGRLTFVDTETTGLSGGAGNVAFLIGLGRLEAERLRIDQYFLTDFPGERELLETIAPELAPERTLVSYNGKSFDLPILRTRFLMNGLRLESGAHIDLLHPTRRLWGNALDSCSLHSIEERVLGIERDEDVPSIMVPELYFQFLRSGDARVIRPVFAHHLYDVSSLAVLFALLERVASDSDREGTDAPPNDERCGVAPDEYALTLLLLDRGAPHAPARLAALAERGDPRAARLLGRLYRRRGEHERAAEVWRALWSAGSRFGGVELAKHLEHRARDPRAALDIVERLCLMPRRGFPGEERERAELLARKARLERKLRPASPKRGAARSPDGRR